MAIIPIFWQVFLPVAAAAAFFALALRQDGGAGRAGGWLALAGTAAHAAALAARFWQDGGIALASVVSAFMLATLALTWRQLTAAAARRALAGLTAAAALAPLAHPAGAVSALSPHAACALAAYTLAAVAFWLCLDIRLTESALRRDPAGAAPQSLLARERRCFGAVFLAFVLLTITLGSGVVSAAAAGGTGLSLTHKNLFGALTWLVFGALLLGRWRAGWRGKRAQRWFFCGYAFLLLSYVGSAAVRQLLLNG